MIWQQILEEPAVGEMLPDSIVGFVPVFDAVCYRAPGTIPSLELMVMMDKASMMTDKSDGSNKIKDRCP